MPRHRHGAQEKEWNRIVSICLYYEDRGDQEKTKSCLECMKTLPNKESVSNEDVQSCMDKLPEKFQKCGTQPDAKTCLLNAVNSWRWESGQLFQKLHKSVLTQKQSMQVFEVWSAFMMFLAMHKELPPRSTNILIEPILPCFDPTEVDLSKYDEHETAALEESRNIRATEAAERGIIKSIYLRTWRLYTCSMERITGNAEAKSIILDFKNSFHGAVPAKVARLYCDK